MTEFDRLKEKLTMAIQSGIMPLSTWGDVEAEFDRIINAITALVDDSLIDYTDEATGHQVRLDHMKTIKRILESIDSDIKRT